MSFDGDHKQWKCGTGVTSIVRDIGEPCLHQSPIKVVVAGVFSIISRHPHDRRGLNTQFASSGKGFYLAFHRPKSMTWDWCYALFDCYNANKCKINKMLKPDKWQTTFDSDGKVYGFQKALKLIALGGVDPSIRPEVWEFLLGCYTLSSTAEHRRQLRTARRERYRDLVKQCQLMHSSIGTGSLAYVVGSKVMDMRTMSKDEGRKEAEAKSGQDSNADADRLENCCGCSNNCTDTSHENRRESSSDSADLTSVRGSIDAATYDSSCFMPSPSPYNCSSPKLGCEAHESQYGTENYFDFPPLPVTDLFEKCDKDEKARKSLEGRLSSRRELKFEDDHVYNFQISNNVDLVIDSSPSKDASDPRNSVSEMVHPNAHELMSRSSNLEYEAEIINGLRISDATEIPAINVTSKGGTVTEGRVSEWLWTLHQIVVDVVRTDSHLEFYEDTKNLARMSDILAVYAWVDPSTGYCQGMSDLLSPFVVLFEDDADAFWCFEMLLRRMRENFKMEGPTGVMKQLQALWNILEYTDREMFAHLSHIGAESLHFAFRMLLVLFRRELSFSEALCMWEMMWAADFDESTAFNLEESCPELLVLQIPTDSDAPIGEDTVENENCDSNGGLQPKPEIVERSISDDTEMRSTSAYPFCGLTKNFWSKNDRFQICTIVSSTRNGDDELPIFCVAAILITNRHKIIRETRSIDDLIKIFNDNMLKIRVRRCVRTAIKLRKKYFYKLIKNRPAARDGD